MKFAAARHRSRGIVVDITPMIDVVFLLIIFFMTTAQFAQLTRAEVDLPQERGEQQAEAEQAGIVVNITGEGQLIVSGRTVGLGELESIVRLEIAREPDRPAQQLKLLIRADRNAPAARLNRVVEVLRPLGVGAARLATEVPR
ncbi:MAG: ExbD/TolR family protein [Planctomycetota bacterium]|jgi:biopolymer transport protein ExbD